MADYVDRRDVIDTIATKPDLTGDERCALYARVRAIKPADVRPVGHGSWRAVSFHEVACTKCGYVVDIMKADVDHMKFCNNCGADMRPEPPEREVLTGEQ